MQVNVFSEGVFWNKVSSIETTLQSKISLIEVKENRSKVKLLYGLLESAKFAMIIGRPKRAWSFYYLAYKVSNTLL